MTPLRYVREVYRAVCEKFYHVRTVIWIFVISAALGTGVAITGFLMPPTALVAFQMLVGEMAMFSGVALAVQFFRRSRRGEYLGNMFPQAVIPVTLAVTSLAQLIINCTRLY
jgi:uncharacterized membrane protein HdeD (DUF308 family)